MGNIELSIWISLGALLLAGLTLWNRIFSGRDKIVDDRMMMMQKTCSDTIEKQDAKFNERMKGMSDAWTRANTETRQTMYSQFSLSRAATEQNTTKISKLELDMLEKFSLYPNKADLKETLDTALQPIRENQEKNSQLMEEVLRSGILRDKRDARRDQGN